MHGEYGKSIGPKVCLLIGHTSAVVVAAWILFGSKSGALFVEILPYPDSPPDFIQKLIILFCSITYLFRLCITGFCFLQRALHWNESLGIMFLLLLLHPGFAILAHFPGPMLWIVAIVGLALYALGSFLNTYSELQRYRWKKHHPGSLYTQGLFRWSMHINYFGDVVLFTGFAMVTGSSLALIVPVVMGVTFAVYHIPKLDRHLSKYGDAFQQWEAKTSKLIPFVY